MSGASEKKILNDTLVAVSKLTGSLFYRNNTGQAWQGRNVTPPVGQYVKVVPGMMILADARIIRFGLPGSGDIKGSFRGRAVDIEIKAAIGRQSTVQTNYERAWTLAGGIYILARSPHEAVDSLNRLCK